jgi:hypothetical protein
VTRFLVMVEIGAPHDVGPPAAGIYVMAKNKEEAKDIVRALLVDSRLTVYVR